MKFFTNMKIGARLALGFITVLALTLLVGAFSISRLEKIQDNVADLATNWMVASRALGDFSSSVAAHRRSEALHVLASKPEEFQASEKAMESRKQLAETAWKRYETTVTEADEKRLAQDIRTALAAYYASGPKLIALSV